MSVYEDRRPDRNLPTARPAPQTAGFVPISTRIELTIRKAVVVKASWRRGVGSVRGALTPAVASRRRRRIDPLRAKEYLGAGRISNYENSESTNGARKKS